MVEGITAMYYAKPTGVPALRSTYEKLAKDNPLLRQLNTVVECGQVMPTSLRWAVSLAPLVQLSKSPHRVELLPRQPFRKPRQT